MSLPLRFNTWAEFSSTITASKWPSRLLILNICRLNQEKHQTLYSITTVCTNVTVWPHRAVVMRRIWMRMTLWVKIQDLSCKTSWWMTPNTQRRSRSRPLPPPPLQKPPVPHADGAKLAHLPARMMRTDLLHPRYHCSNI